MTALGLYRISLNGVAAGDNVLAPGWTDYSKRLLYQTYDVTYFLVDGDNAIGAIVADGWACGFFGFDHKHAGRPLFMIAQLLAQLVVRCADEEHRIATDGSWVSSTGRIVHSDLLMGEGSDPAREPEGWDCPGFDATAWRPVACRERGPAQLVADPGPPIVVAEEVPARSVKGLQGELIVDFGQNLAGWCRLRVDEPAGRLVAIRHGEVLAPDGGLYLDNLRTARQSDTFTASGGQEDLEPRFTLHGFRYAGISGLSAPTGHGRYNGRCCSLRTHPGLGHLSVPHRMSTSSLRTSIGASVPQNFISVPT